MAQIATITVETAGGPVDLPVYEPGDSGSNRLEAFRVQTASGPGFVPLAAVDEADRPYLRVQTSSGVRAVDTSASGIPDSVVDNFEDKSNGGVYGQLSDFYNGDLSDFDRNTSSPLAEGNHSLKVTGSNSTYVITSPDGNGLNYYPEAGDTIRWNFYFSGGGSWPFVDMRFAVNGSSNYQCSLNRAKQQVRIYKDASTAIAEDTSPGLPVGEILEAEFDWGSGGSLTLTVYDSQDNQISQVSANDSDYSDGGIEIAMGQDGQTVMIDDIRTV